MHLGSLITSIFIMILRHMYVHVIFPTQHLLVYAMISPAFFCLNVACPAGCKENHLYSLPFRQSEANINFTSPDKMFQLAPKAFWRAELISQFFCYSNSSKFTSPMVKSTSPGWLSGTTFFARCPDTCTPAIVISDFLLKKNIYFDNTFEVVLVAMSSSCYPSCVIKRSALLRFSIFDLAVFLIVMRFIFSINNL